MVTMGAVPETRGDKSLGDADESDDRYSMHNDGEGGWCPSLFSDQNVEVPFI